MGVLFPALDRKTGSGSTTNNNKNTFFSSEYPLIIVLYCIAQGLLLFNRGIYWDDWTLYNVPPPDIIITFQQAGSEITGHFHNILLASASSISMYHTIVFFSFLMAGILFNEILKNFTFVTPGDRLILVLFFMLIPVNSARITMICTPYAICYLAFFLGFWLVLRYLQTMRFIYRIFALGVFFIAFITQSLLVLYLIVILSIIYFESSSSAEPFRIQRFIIKYLDFIAIPLLFFSVKTQFFRPSGVYAGYQTISSGAILAIPVKYLLSFYSSFLEVIQYSIPDSVPEWILVIAGSWILYFYLVKRIDISKNENCLLLFGLGLFLFLLALVPYFAIGKHVPNVYDWNSRDQLLIPMGICFILYYVLKISFLKIGLDKRAICLVFSFLIAMFAIASCMNYIDFQGDWYKQEALIENFKASDITYSHTTFLFNDTTTYLNANTRVYRFYEYSGMMKSAFGDETRLGDNWDKYNPDKYGKYLITNYNLGGYLVQKPQYLVTIQRGNLSMITRQEIFYVMINDLLSHDGTINKKDVLSLHFEKILD